MDKQNKSVASGGRSHSNSSRRVMWKMDKSCKDEEEVFDSIVTYRWMPSEVASDTTKASKSNPEVAVNRDAPNKNWRMLVAELGNRKKLAQKEQPITSQASVQKSNSLAKLEGLESKERAKASWQRLFNTIKLIKKGELPEEEKEKFELSGSPSLALRYKPSHESLKFKRSKDQGLDHIHQQPSTSQAAAINLKIETCDLPPHQTCIVREVPPMFAHRVRVSMSKDTDSCSSGELDLQRNGTASEASRVTGPLKQLESVVVTTPLATSFSSGPHVGPKRGTVKPTKAPSASTHSLSASGRKVPSPSNSGTVDSSSESVKKLTSPSNSCSAGGSSPEAITSSNSGTAGGSPSLSGKRTTRPSGSSTARSQTGKTSSIAGSGMPNLRQRQQELHRYRLLVEQLRVELLQLKVKREIEGTHQQHILFRKDLQIKENLLRTYDDNDVSHA
ncbi:uncharacterized protein LOC108155016 [Drosophila miranda]|uniref:uncharacterized protein LOC108155016 n=1 Tax=Drosophila miranda TaxID=7229 RepID=UPI0007E85655|nr:uncharacterized protein LOC108155016 [Drosophila miranda]